MIKKLLQSPWPLLSWTILIFILLSVDTSSVESVPFLGIKNLDKLVHAFLFGLMALLWVYRQKRMGWLSLFLIFIAVSSYGTAMEFYQENFTTREFEWNDVIADTIGAGMGTLIGKKIGPYGNRGRNQN